MERIIFCTDCTQKEQIKMMKKKQSEIEMKNYQEGSQLTWL